MATEFPRSVHVYARGMSNQLLPGTKFTFLTEGQLIGEVLSSDGRASIEIPSKDLPVTIEAELNGKKEIATLSLTQDQWTYQFPVREYSAVRAHLAAIIGLVLLAVALVLAFALGTLNPLQTRLVLITVSLAGGLIATEIPGLLNAKVSLGEQIGIAAGGAIAVFVILFFAVPAQ
jgi:hypothetical protein